VTVETWSRQTGELVRSSVLQLPSHVMQVEVARVEELALSPDARLLAVGTTGLAPRVMLWDVATRRQQGDPLFVQGEEYTGGPLSADARRAHLGVITSLRFDAAGKRLAAGSASGRIKVWDVPSTYLVASLDGHGDRVTGLSFLDDATLASTSADHAVAAWTLAEPSPLMLDQPYHESYGASAMAVSPDGRTVVAGEANGLITVWNTDEPLSQSHFPTADRLLSLAVSPDGSTLASTHADATVRLWSLADGTPLSVLEPQAGPVWTATFSQDGSLLAAGTNDGTTVVWDVASSRRTHEFALRNAVKTVAFSPDGNFLSSAGSDNRVVMWDLAAEDVAWSVFASERSFVSVEDVAFSPDGGTLAVAASDGVLLLDAGTGAPSGALDAPLGDAQYTAVAFALDGRLLAAASSEGALLWDRAARQQIGDAFSTPSPFGDDLAVDDVAFARSGHLIGLSTGLPKRLHRWPTRSTASSPVRARLPDATCLRRSGGSTSVAEPRPVGPVRPPARCSSRVRAPMQTRWT
jgi:WD40 repeat protein